MFPRWSPDSLLLWRPLPDGYFSPAVAVSPRDPGLQKRLPYFTVAPRLDDRFDVRGSLANPSYYLAADLAAAVQWISLEVRLHAIFNPPHTPEALSLPFDGEAIGPPLSS